MDLAEIVKAYQATGRDTARISNLNMEEENYYQIMLRFGAILFELCKDYTIKIDKKLGVLKVYHENPKIHIVDRGNIQQFGFKYLDTEYLHVRMEYKTVFQYVGF